MNLAPPIQGLKFIVAGLILLLLACTPVNRLVELNKNGRAVATAVAVIDKGDFTALAAYKRLNRLPGYRLESRHTAQIGPENSITLVTTSHLDADGNKHTVTQTADNQQIETYVVDGQTYIFNPQYSSWVNVATNSPPISFQYNNPHQWLSQFGVVPIEAGRETIQARSAIRYTLQDVVTNLTDALGQSPAGAASTMQGTLWVDTETGALLKSEIFFFERESRQPAYEFTLDVTEIGSVHPIQAPTPIANPDEIVSATATAQAWSSLQVALDFQDRPIEFDLIPVEIRQAAAGTAEMKLVLRGVPSALLKEPDRNKFLTQLGSLLTLSIPKNNLTALSNKFHLEADDISNQSLDVIYTFEANLEDFSHVEMILSSPGNPLFSPVPVAGK